MSARSRRQRRRKRRLRTKARSTTLSSAHSRLFKSVSAGAARPKEIVQSETEEMKERLDQALEYGQVLVNENKELHDALARSTEFAKKQRQYRKAFQHELSEVRATNETLEDQFRESRATIELQALEVNLAKSKMSQLHSLEEEVTRLNFRVDGLKKNIRSQLDEVSELRDDKTKLQEKVLLLEKLLRDQSEESESVKRTQGEFDELTEHTHRLLKEKEEALLRSKALVRKLSVRNERLRKEFELKLEIVKNNLGVSIQNARLSLKKVKRDVVLEISQTEEDVTALFMSLVYFVQDMNRQHVQETEEREIESEKREKELIRQLEDEEEEEEEEGEELFPTLRIDDDEPKPEPQPQPEPEPELTVEAAVEEPPEDDGVDRGLLLRWFRRYVPRSLRSGRKVTELDYETFGDGVVLGALLTQFNPDWFDIRQCEIDEVTFPAMAEVVFDVMEVQPTEDFGKYLWAIFEIMKDHVDSEKSSLRTSVAKLKSVLDAACVMPVRDIHGLNKLIQKKKYATEQATRLGIHFASILRFLSPVESDEAVRLSLWYRKENLRSHVSRLSDRILKMRMKLFGTKPEMEDTQARQKYDELAHEYFVWSKRTQVTFLEKDADVHLDERNIHPPYEDDEASLLEKGLQLKKNGEFVRQVWDCYGDIADLDDSSVVRPHFSKDEIELENDVVIFALKGLQTSKLKAVERVPFPLEEEGED